MMGTKDLKRWLGQYLPPKSVQDSNNYPKISIITPSFNYGDYLEQTIRSVLLQNYPNLEYIIIDGGSTDDTINIIKQYEPWVSYWVSETDSGQSEAINKGIRRATGEWIAWINADDIYFPDTLKTIASIIKENKTTSWVVGSTVFIDNDFNEIGNFQTKLYSTRSGDKAYQKRSWLDYVCYRRAGINLPQPSSFWKLEVVVKAGYLDESLHFAMDRELYGRLAMQGLSPYILDKPLACFRVHPGQKTSSLSSCLKEERKIVKKLMRSVTWADRLFLGNYLLWFDFKLFKKTIKRYRRKIFHLIKEAGNHLLVI